jgi:hypothetical protein
MAIDALFSPEPKEERRKLGHGSPNAEIENEFPPSF